MWRQSDDGRSCRYSPDKNRTSWRPRQALPTSPASTPSPKHMPDSRPQPTQATLTPDVGGTDHILGPDGAAITLVEYGDFECEFCGRAYPELKRLLKQVGGKVRFVFRHFPIPEEHPHAQH